MVKIIKSIFVFTLFASALISCRMKAEPSEQDSATLKASIPPTEIITYIAKRKPFEYLITTSGKVESAYDIHIPFKVEGVVSKVYATNGQYVNKGDLLVTIENEKFKLEVDKAEVQLKERRVEFEDKITGFKGQEGEKLKVILENIRYSSGLAAAEISFAQAKLTYENSILKSPITGIISNLEIREGSTTKPGDVFCEIHEPHALLVSCEVLEADAFIISKEQAATVQPLFEKEKSFKAYVSNINPRVDVKTGLVKIKLVMAKAEKLLPGMNVSVTIKVPYSKNIIVPKEAIVIRSGRQVVFTEENGLAKWNYVTTGRENGKEIEVTDGLLENKKVIITNNLQLAHDAPVKAVDN